VQVDTSGNFPKEVAWYELCTLSPTPNNRPLLPADLDSPSFKGHAPKRGSPSIRHISSTSASAPLASPPSAIIATWIPHSDHCLVPELWQYMLPPEEEFRCLNLRQKIWDLNLDLQAFTVVGSRLFLLGYQGPPGAHDEATDDDDDDDEDAVWNVCVEVSLEHQSNVGVF